MDGRGGSARSRIVELLVVSCPCRRRSRIRGDRCRHLPHEYPHKSPAKSSRIPKGHVIIMQPFHRRLGGLLTLTAAACFGLASIAFADSATMSPTSGTAAIDGSGLRDAALDTAFNLAVAAGGHCSGNASSGFVVRSYFIGSGVTLSSVDFGALGLPLPASGTGSGTTFVSALPNVSGAAFFVNPGSSSPFLVTGLPQLSMYRMVNRATIPAGAYRIGVACVGPTNFVDGANFWDTAITISNQSASSLTWGLNTTTTSTTSTSTTSTTSTTTTTIVGGSTTSTTSTIVGGTTTTTTRPLSTTTSVAVGGGGGTIPRTGNSSSGSLVLLGVLTLLIGRIVLLVARPVRVLPPQSR